MNYFQFKKSPLSWNIKNENTNHDKHGVLWTPLPKISQNWAKNLANFRHFGYIEKRFSLAGNEI